MLDSWALSPSCPRASFSRCPWLSTFWRSHRSAVGCGWQRILYELLSQQNIICLQFIPTWNIFRNRLQREKNCLWSKTFILFLDGCGIFLGRLPIIILFLNQRGNYQNIFLTFACRCFSDALERGRCWYDSAALTRLGPLGFWGLAAVWRSWSLVLVESGDCTRPSIHTKNR